MATSSRSTSMPRAQRAIEHHPLLYGDWTPWIRDPIDVLRLTFLVGAAVAALVQDWESALRLLLTFVVVLAARRLSLPRPLDLALWLGMGLQAFGNAFGLFEVDWPYDKVVHFVLPFAVAPTAYVLLIRVGLVPDLADTKSGIHPAGIVVATFGLGLTVGVAYEIYEYLAVKVLGAGLHVSYGDTIADLADDAAGALFGGMLLVLWATRGWGTTRRAAARH